MCVCDFQCPVFFASREDLEDPIGFIKSIEEVGKKAGIAIIRLPVDRASPPGTHFDVTMTLHRRYILTVLMTDTCILIDAHVCFPRDCSLTL